MEHSAFKKFEQIIQGPTLPGQITYVNTLTDGGNTFAYWQVGRFYVGWSLVASPDGAIGGAAGAGNASADRFAALLGLTVSTYYTNDVNTNIGNTVYWNGAAWVNPPSSAEILVGFLSN